MVGFNRVRRSLVVSAGLLIAAAAAHAGSVVYGAAKGPALQGFDPVAYFTEGAPKEGSARYTHEWNGAIWRFVSAENRDRFQAEPERFAPQYGGYCAFAMSGGSFRQNLFLLRAGFRPQKYHPQIPSRLPELFSQG